MNDDDQSRQLSPVIKKQLTRELMRKDGSQCGTPLMLSGGDSQETKANNFGPSLDCEVLRHGVPWGDLEQSPTNFSVGYEGMMDLEPRFLL